jgi:metallo-beta-lactamase family protein
MEISAVAKVVANEAESKALNERKGPMIILSASGMATGGRVLHHLRAFGPHAENTILFTGFQAEGTRGAYLVNGQKEVKIHGQMVPIRAEVINIDAFSAHADAGEILYWLSQFKRPPKKIFITHGELSAAEALKAQIEEKLVIPCVIPTYKEEILLD